MKVGIISDTHGVVLPWKRVLGQIFRDVEVILHAGDVLYHGPRNPVLEGYAPQELAIALNECPVPVLIARGNCDAEVDQMLLNIPLASPYLFTVLNGKRVLVHHGHSLQNDELEELTRRWDIDLCISGHTHVAAIEKKNGTVYFNPGSCSLPKGAGVPSVGLWDNDRLLLICSDTGRVLDEYPL